jgi:hypothetical protein
MSRVRRLAPFALVLAVGCGRTADTTAGTGAKEATLAFFQAVVRNDPAAAYATLSPESKLRCSPDAFVRLARDYVRYLEFTPEMVSVTAADEHGDDAVAHIVLAGKGHNRSRFKDTVTLRRDATGWVVQLPANFGKK